MLASEQLFAAYLAGVRRQRPGQAFDRRRADFSLADFARVFEMQPQRAYHLKAGRNRIPASMVAEMAREIPSPALPWLLALQAQYARTDADRTVWQMALADAGGLPATGGDEDKPLTRHLVDAMGGWDTAAQALTYEAMAAAGDPDGARDARQAKALSWAKEVAKRLADGETYDDLRARYPAIDACRDVESALALAVRAVDDGELAEIRALADA